MKRTGWAAPFTAWQATAAPSGRRAPRYTQSAVPPVSNANTSVTAAPSSRTNSRDPLKRSGPLLAAGDGKCPKTCPAFRNAL